MTGDRDGLTKRRLPPGRSSDFLFDSFLFLPSLGGFSCFYYFFRLFFISWFNLTLSSNHQLLACLFKSTIIVLPRAATRRAQLTVTTSSTKRRKVAEPRRPGGALPGLSFASQAGRRHSLHPPSDSSSLPPNPRPSSTSGSNRSRSPSVSPSPRYIPAHLQEEVLGTAARSPTPESASSAADYPSIACAGLTLHATP